MSKSILTIETPASCKRCPIKSQIHSHQYFCHGAQRKFTMNATTVQPWCPLVPMETENTVPKTTVKIDNTSSCDWLYQNDDMWKDYVQADFDEIFVITGNRHSVSIEKASWFIKAKEFLKELDENEPEDIDYKDFGLTKEQFDSLVKLYNTYNQRDREMWLLRNIAVEMNPQDSFRLKTINGYSQSDWQTVLYKSTNLSDDIINTLENFYFGKIAEIIVENEDGVTVGVMTHDELWDLQRDNKLKERICSDYDLVLENTVFLESDGEYRTTKYKEI